MRVWQPKCFSRLGAPIVLLAAMATLAACARSPTGPGPLPVGTWGGPQGNLAVFADSATLDLPCAAGRIPAALVTAGDGSFDVAGQWAPQVGPVQLGGPFWQSARFSGRRDGDTLEMNVQVSGGATIGPLMLTRGVVGQFARCV